MSMSATIALSSAQTTVGKRITATVTISNSGGSDVTVSSLNPRINITSESAGSASASLGVVRTGGAITKTVPASGSLALTFNIIPHASSAGPLGGGSGTYDISADITTSDGSQFRPTAATLSVYPRTTTGIVSLSRSLVTVANATRTSAQTTTLTLTMYDENGIAFTKGGFTVTFATSGGVSTGTIGSVTDNKDGTYSATFTAVLAGTATSIIGSIGGNAVTSTAPTITVSNGAASKLIVTTQPSGAAHGSPFVGQPIVKVEDAAGNTVLGSTAAVAFAIQTDGSSGSALSGTTTVNAVAGVATFTNLQLDKAGAGFILQATSSGLTAGNTAAFTVT